MQICRAKLQEFCPSRILEPMNEAVIEIADATDTPLVDVRKLFEEQSEGRIPGGYLLVDHVHPSIAGHRLIAEALIDELIRLAVVEPAPNWREEYEQAAREHLDALGDFYFAQGQERLEALRLWTLGKAGQTRLGTAVPDEESE